MHTGNQIEDVSLAKEFQEHLTKSIAKMVSLIRENKKMFIEIKWIDRQYHVQDNADVELKDVKMY